MRRFWMLLLVVIALFAFMAFPAMAAETCTCDGTHLETDGWLKLDNQTVETLVDGGKYYVDGGDTGTLAKYLILTGLDEMNITICLNGKVWTGEENYNGTGYPMRPLTLNDGEGSVTVNIVDCSAEGTGTLQGVDYADKENAYGGASYVSNGNTLNFYSGTIVGGSAVNGGGVYVTGKTEFNMHGGVIKDGTASNQGGNIYVSSSTSVVNFVGGTIQDGTARNGGNLYLANGKFNMGTEGNTSVTSPAISGGENTSSNGGSIYQNAGTFKLMSGIVSGGKAANAGSNIYVASNGTLEMTGGKFSDPNKSGTNQNVFIVNGALKMSGGEIAGNISFTNSGPTATSRGCLIELSGSAKITGNGASLGWWRDTSKYTTEDLFDSPRVVIAEPLTENAEIVVNSISEGETPDRPTVFVAATETGWADYRAYIAGDDPIIYTTKANTTLTLEADGIHQRSTADDVLWHCYCGWINNKHDAGCVEFCGGYDVSWNPWNGASIEGTAEPADGVDRYYVTQDYVYVDDTNDTRIASQLGIGYYGYNRGLNASKDVNRWIALDMNGHNIHGKGDRLIQVRPGTDFTVCNSQATGGELKNTGSGATSGNYGVMQVLGYKNTISMMRGVTFCYEQVSDTTTKKTEAVMGIPCTFNMYGGKIKGDPQSTVITNAGAVYVNAGTDTKVSYTYKGVFNMYEDAVIEGGYASNLGSAIRINGAEFNCYGGTITGSYGKSGGAVYISSGSFTAQKGASGKNATITGGSAVSGGAFYVAGGTVTLNDGTVVTGGSATNGGVLYATGGTFTANKATINASTVTENGGAFYVDGANVTLKNGTAVNGTKTVEEAVTVIGNAANGGVVYVAGGSFTAQDGTTITGGAATNGGAVYVAGGSFVAQKGLKADGKTAGDAVTITGGTASGYGGAVYMAGGTFDLKGSTVTGGTAIYGGAVYMTGTSTSFNMSENAYVTYGTAKGASTGTWSPGGNFYVNQGTLNVENSTISNGQDTEAGLLQTNVEGNNLYINFSGTVNLNNGAKIINSANNSEASIHMQGGVLNIHAGSEITNNENVVCRNIFMNANALCRVNSAKTAFTFEYVDYAPVINMDGGVISGGRYTSNGANIHMNHKGQLNMTGGEIRDGVINGTNTGGSGANIYVPALSNNTTVNGVKGVLTAYQASSQDRADTTIADLAAKVTIEGTAKVIGGVTKNYTTTAGTVTKPNGGSIYMGDNTTLTIGGTAEIYGGTTGNGGGNLYSNGHVTVKEQAKIYNGWSSSRDWDNAFFVNADVELLGGEIHGGVAINGSSVGTLKLSGSPVVDPALCTLDKKPAKGLHITYNKATEENPLPTTTLASFTVEGLEKDANVILSVSVPASNVVLASSVDETSVLEGLHYLTSGYYIQKNEQSQLVLLTKADVTGVTVNGGGVVYTLDEAVSKVAEGDYVTLVNSIADATISKSIQLDLDGNSLTNLTLADGVELKLFDASTVDYVVEEVKDGEGNVTGYTGYGIVTLSADNKGQILRQGNTPKATYGHNYRFVVLKEGDDYSAHRIYLAVKSTILYPNKAAVNYRTALRCDQLVAKYINAEGGGFGILASADNASYSDYTVHNISASAWDGENENNLITRLNGLLDESNDISVNTTFATAKVKAQAYIYLADDFTENALASGTDYATKTANTALIAGEGLTSSGVNQSLQGMVQIAFAKDPDTLDPITKEALYHMYSTWSEGLMENWSLRYLQDYKDLYDGVDMRYACLCGHPDSENNPCADNGHVQITWRAWDSSTGAFPSESGNYYLTENLVLNGQGTVEAEDFINLNTNGFGISVKEGVKARVANVYGVLNLTNFGIDGQAVEESTVQATCLDGGNGGVLLILNDNETYHGNVSLYSGVTLTAQDNHYITNGIVEAGGDLNIYGGTIRGATMNTSKLVSGVATNVTSTGGAVGVASSGYVYMNSGSIIGGQAMRGGAIYVGVNGEGQSTAVVELEGGTITGGTADDGGMIYMAGGTLLNNGVDLDASACYAKRGAMMYLAGGQVAMAGTADDKLTLTGGNVVSVIKSVDDLNAAQPTNSKGEVTTDASVGQAGSGGVFYVAGGSLDLDYCTITGGATKQIPLDGNPDVSLTRTAAEGKEAIGSYSNDLDSHGGSVLYISNGEVTIDACQLNGYVDSKVNKRGGNIYMVGGEVTVDGDEKVTGSSTLTAGWSGVNATVLCQTGGTFTMNEDATLTSADIFGSEGKLKAGVTYGGTVAIASGSNPIFNMYGGTITGGKIKANVTSNHGGGNVSLTSGTFNMYGGEITSGISLATAVNSNLSGGGNVRVDGGTFNMTGGSITGGEAKNGLGGGLLLKSGTLNISGNARVTGNTDGTDANNIYLASGMTINLGKLETIDSVSPELGVTMATFGGNVTSGNTENTQQTIENAWLASDKGLDMIQVEGADFYIGRYGCICGATNAEDHIGECVGTAVLWTPWLDETHLPDQAGYWYLAYEGEVTVSEQAGVGAGSTTNVNVVVDLNGKTVRRADTGDNNRFFALRSGATEDVVNTLTITDSSVGHTGKLVCVDEGTGQGLGVWVQADNGILNLYRGTIDASESTADTYRGNAIYLDGGQVNMYGGKLIGGTNHKGGGAVFMENGTGFNMVGGQIIAGEALCTQAANGTDTEVSGGITYTYPLYKCSTHGEGGAVYVDTGATFDMSGGTVTIPTMTEEQLATYRGAGHGGLFCVLGTLNLSGDATLTGGRANGAGNALGVLTVGRSDCGYGGNIYISSTTVSGEVVSGVVNVTSGDVTISDGYATGGVKADGTYTDPETSEVKTLTDIGGAGGGLGGNICVSGTLNMTAGTLEGGYAITGGNIGTNSDYGRIYLGVPAEVEGTVDEKTVQILDGTAGGGGNLAINVRPCAEFVINRGTWIEGGKATGNGGNIVISPWQLSVEQYVSAGTDEDGNTLYETDYDALITVNGGTITGGIAGNLGGNIYLYGDHYTRSAAYGKVYVHAKMILGEGTVISNGAAANNGNNLYLNSYGDAILGGTVRNTLPQGPWPSEGTAEYTVSKNSVFVGTITSHLTLEATGSIVNEKAADAEEVPHIRNLYVNSGYFTMNGGTISGGYLVEKGDSGANVVVNAGTNNATFVMNGGEIKDGVYGYTSASTGDYEAYNGGGNMYVRGIFQMHGGVISGGKCLAADAKDGNNKDVVASAHGGNVLVYGGQLTMDGTAQIKDGKVAYSGGNVYIANAGTLTMDSADASITGGMSTWYNGGNVYVNSGCTFTLNNGTVSDGITRDGGGNVYSNGTINMSGGKVEAGLSGATWADHTDYASERTYANANASNSNVFMVNSHLYMSGGEIDTGMASTRTKDDPRTIKFSGNAKVGGRGFTLGSTSYTVTENETTTTHYYNLDTVDVTELGEGGEIYINAAGLSRHGDYIRLVADLDDLSYTTKLMKEGMPEESQVVYMTAANAPDGLGGIYLYNGAKYRFHCLCGVNDDEVTVKGHLPGCDGTELVWRAWTSTTLPTEPGNWFLYYTSLSNGTDGEEAVKYKAIGTGSLKHDYYQDSEGNWHGVRALLSADAEGNFLQLADKSFQQATDASGNPIWLNSAGTAIADLGEYQVVDSYTINLDLNGYKLEGPTDNRNLTFYGRSDFNVTSSNQELATTLAGYSGVYTVTTSNGTETQKFSTHRQGKVTYTIVDASQGHTAVLATAGRYSGKTRTAYSQPQGTNIWMYWMMDTLNTYRTTIDASSSIHGWGMALTVEGTANLYDTKLIGGIAQGYFSKTETLTDSEGNEHQVDTLSGSAVGGGALYISPTGIVNMYGGEIKDGMSIYRYMDGTNGADADRAVGGGNVYTNGEFNVKGTGTYPASITGGKALYYAETDGEVNNTSSYATKQGGGVYLGEGTMTVEGNVTITGNSIGTVTAATDGSVPGTVVPTTIANEVSNNLYLNGNTVTVKSLTGTVGFTMNGTDWEGVFAEVDTGDTSYVGTKLIPDVAQTNEVTYADGLLRYAAQVDTLQVGYGAASIYPTQQDIANGLILGGYGNNSYSSSGELMRMTRYWGHDTKESSMPATVYNRTVSTDDSFIDMKATAMAFRDTEGDTVIIINVDYNNVSDDVGNKVKQLVSVATGVPIDNITISASHQHTGPNMGKTYWTDLEGNYTKSYEQTHDGVTLLDAGSDITGTYETIIYGNEKLEAWEELQVRTNYGETFYNGVRTAAVAAYNDLKDVVSVSGGIMDTTTDGNQYNFVRNVALYDASDLTTVKGMITDNHVTHYSMRDSTVAGSASSYYSYSQITDRFDFSSLSTETVYVGNSSDPYHISNLVQKPESELDVTMQLVKYERADKTIVLANFQSHPHLSDGGDNLNPNGGVVEIFRQNLSAAYGTEDKPCQVLYFSGAGGNVNSSAKIGTSEYTNLQPWFELQEDGTYKNMASSGTNAAKRAVQAQYHGEGLAALANTFLGTSSNLSVTVDPTKANVQIKTVDFEYGVWDEAQSYTVSGVTIPATWSETKKTNAALLINWEKGGYLARPGSFTNTIGGYTDPQGNSSSYWQYFVGNYSEKNDKIYSFFHANGVRKRYVRKQAENMSGTFEIKAYDLGGIGFVAAPYEMFQESGQAIKGNVQSTLQASQPTKYADFPDYVTNGCGYIASEGEEVKTSPYGITIIASQTTGAQGYIPSVIGYKNGGYATDTTLFEPGTGEQLVTAYVDMLHEMNATYTATTAEGE